MFECFLGLKVIRLDSNEFLIGDVYIDEINQIIKIINPFGLNHVKTQSTENIEKYKVTFSQYSKYGTEKEIIINSSKWIEMVNPAESIREQYYKITKGIQEIKEDFDKIDMKSIVENDKQDTSQIKKPKKAKKLPPSKPNKKRDINDRWIDKL
jgi:hypothetical protein